MHTPRTRRIIFLVLLLAAILVTFRHGINAQMTGDGYMLIYNNPLITAPDGILHVFQAEFCKGCRVDTPVNVATGFYRPLVNAVFWLEYRFAGTNDAIYNFDQLLFHWACALMVFFFAARLWPDKPLVPFIAATLFALHPANAYAATRDVRSDLLCLLFYLGALIAYLRAFPAAAPRRKGFILLALACYLGAILSKEMGVTLPAVLVMLHFRQRYAEGRPAREILYTLPFWILFAAYMAARSLLLTDTLINPYALVYPPLVLYINVIKNFSIYILRYLLPLGAEYPELLPKNINVIDPSFTDAGIYLSLGLLLLISGAALFNIRRRPTAAFLAFFMLITMSPLIAVTHILDIPDINTLRAAERFMYLPSVPLLLLTAIFFHGLYQRLQKDMAKKSAVLAGAGIALFLGYQSNNHTVAINSEWAKLQSLYLLPKERLTPRMLLDRECLYVRLVALPMRKYDESKERLGAVLKENPSTPFPYVVLGTLYANTEQWDQLTHLLKQWNNLTKSDIINTLRDNPTIWNDYIGVYHNFPYLLGVAAVHRGETREAADLLCSALRRGYGEPEVIGRLRANYLLNGPPQCRTAQDEALCMKNASVPDFAEWRRPLDPKRCEDWKKLF